MWYHLNVESKNKYKWTNLWDGSRVTDVENKFMTTMAEVGEGKLGDWDWHNTVCKIYNKYKPTV